MAHQDLFSHELRSDVPTGQSPLSRREDLQRIMGSPVHIPLDPLLDSPKPGTVSSNFSPSLHLSPTLGSRRPAVAPRSFLPSPPTWPGHHGGARPSFYPRPWPEPPSNLNAEQDVWSPLRITCLPPLRPKNQIQPITPVSDEKSPAPSHVSVQNSASELGSQVNGYLPSDSGYGTRSIVSSKSATSSFPMDFEGGIHHLPPNIHSRSTATPSLSSLPTSLLVDTVPRHHGTRSACPSVPRPDGRPDQNICDILGCDWTGKCPSDKRKHMLRHEKPFLCKEPGCLRKRGFGTLNDLERHKKCVHKVESTRGPSKRFKCFAENCSRSEQIWPRHDNFKAHLRRMHGDLSIKELIRKSEEWYQSENNQQDNATSYRKPSRREEQAQRNNVRFNDANSLADEASYITARGISEVDVETVQPATLYNDSNSALLSDLGGLGLSRPSTFGSVDGSSHTSMDLAPSGIPAKERPQVEEVKTSHAWNNANPKKRPLESVKRPLAEETISEFTLFRDIHLNRLELPSAESVKESAMGLFEALEKETRNINSQKDSTGGGTDRGLDPENIPSFVDLLRASGEEERLIFQELVRAGLERLVRWPDASSGKKQSRKGSSDGGSSQSLSDRSFVCPYEGCNKRTRRKCEMRKHEIRHKRPYSCTFTNCTKKFGSKNDWKRHENTRHFHHQSWGCREQVTKKNSLEMKECGQNFTRRNIFVDHLRKIHNVDESGVAESLKRSRFGPNSQVRFWCGFCGYPRDLNSQGLKAIDERFDHIDEHLKKGADMTSWTPPTNKNILKGKGQNIYGTLQETIRSQSRETAVQEAANERTKVLQPGFDLYHVPVHVTQNTSYERGTRSVKRPRTTSSRESSSFGRRGSPVSCASLGSQQSNSISEADPAHLEPTVWEPGKHTNKEIAESLIYIYEPPPAREVVSITCCRCKSIPNNLFPSRYDLAIQFFCAVCRHKPCQQCTKHHEVQPASEELRDAN